MLARLNLPFLAFFCLALPAFPESWLPIPPDMLALKQSKTDPAADAEALFRDVRIENGVVGANQDVTSTYIRFKIFTPRGREQYSNVKIEYSGRESIFDVAGRTVHPDGSIVELKKDAIFDKVEVRKGGFKVKVLSFALPAVEPGSIIEYRWTKNAGELHGFYHPFIPLDVQSEYPVDEVTFHLKGFSRDNVAADFRFMPFGCSPERGNRDSKGFTALTVRRVPAYHEEPYSPPGRVGRQWILVYYEENTETNQEKYWASLGRKENAKAREQIKLTAEIKQTAAAIAAKGKTDEEKLALLAEYCRQNIHNLAAATTTTEEREAYKPNNNTGDTFRRQIGTSQDIDFLFIALAQAAGFDARHALVADRRDFLFTPEIRSGFFLNNSDAAVEINGKWRFFDASDEWAPPGTLTWPEQGVYALIPDSKNSTWVQTPLLSSDETKRQRIANLTLSPEGDLEGDIRELFWGNESINWRIENFHRNDAERAAVIREQIKERFADFEVSDIKVTASPDASRPVGIQYHLLVKGYAQRTGKRLFLRPAFFTAGQAALFTEATRVNGVYFPYPWSESDAVDIRLPAGFQLDHPDAPAAFEFKPVGKYQASLAINNATNTLVYRRFFTFGVNQIPEFEARTYPALKSVFDQVHTSDEHIVTLKQDAAPAPAR